MRKFYVILQNKHEVGCSITDFTKVGELLSDQRILGSGDGRSCDLFAAMEGARLFVTACVVIMSGCVVKSVCLVIEYTPFLANQYSAFYLDPCL
jgi:hypothetical protein